MSRSLVFGDARDLQRDQLGAYERAMAVTGDLFRFRVGPPRVGFQFDAVFPPEGAHEVLGSKSSRYVKEAPAYTELALSTRRCGCTRPPTPSCAKPTPSRSSAGAASLRAGSWP
ncbi:MAG: hypothetical protein KY454_14290 [Actinobacteria bacterium]|nr:hypothetical protein [Actinomycetota bacterium]